MMSIDEIGLWRVIIYFIFVIFFVFSRMVRICFINKVVMRVIIFGGGCFGEIVYVGMWFEVFVVLSIDGDRKEVVDSLIL